MCSGGTLVIRSRLLLPHVLYRLLSRRFCTIHTCPRTAWMPVYTHIRQRCLCACVCAHTF
jgi:hypothetical protein